ncbi:hypothetical protein CLV30_10798 [Haloactinopolyspora alba]|uniref:PH domain-containing protein n=1 Tax=Haloactinopolyspora alba TaxID=648780 RepID=A0A2P8E2J2_9ACTN|nr:hypothetical protein [Haloactinopolyspora alba]PSL03617.1 hypothetical protein CLV30_10798 [Haloactinopolyspora alba]
MNTATAVAVLLVVLLGGYGLMWRGWRRRAGRHGDLPPLPEAWPVADDGVEAAYLGTTVSGTWLDRVGAFGLGVRGAATVHVGGDGVLLARRDDAPVPIPATALRGVRADRAGGGRAVRRNEYLIITWEHGGLLLDTAVRPRHRDDMRRLLHTVEPVAEGGTG